VAWSAWRRLTFWDTDDVAVWLLRSSWPVSRRSLRSRLHGLVECCGALGIVGRPDVRIVVMKIVVEVVFGRECLARALPDVFVVARESAE
jgi:hypothetical protein